MNASPFLFALPLLFSLAACSASSTAPSAAPAAAASVPACSNEEALRRLISEKAERGTAQYSFLLPPSMQGRKGVTELLERCGIFLYCSNFEARRQDNVVQMICNYSEPTIIRAALRHGEKNVPMTALQQRTLQEARRVVAQLCNGGMSDFEKTLRLHDYVARNTNYGGACYRASDALLYHHGVCDAFSQALSALLSVAGVENRIVTGYAGGVRHAWNLVHMEGAWYHVDSTWDRPKSNSNRVFYCHDYMGMSDRAISTDHRWERSQQPASGSTRSLYLAKGGEDAVSSVPEFWKKAAAAHQRGEKSFCAMADFKGRNGAELYRVFNSLAGRPTSLPVKSWIKPTNSNIGSCTLFFR